MAGMAANISAFNTVFSYDLWQTYVEKDQQDAYYTRVGRIATVAATLIAIGTALFAASYSNIMDYLQTLFGFFNAPLFATFILGMFWKRMTPTAGWIGLVSGTAGRRPRRRAQRGRSRPDVDRRAAASRARARASSPPARPSSSTSSSASLVSIGHPAQARVRAAGAGLLADAQEGLPRRRRGRPAVVPAAHQARRRSPWSWSSPSTSSSGKESDMPSNTSDAAHDGPAQGGRLRHPHLHRRADRHLRRHPGDRRALRHQRRPSSSGPTGSTSTCTPASAMVVVSALFLLWARLRPVVVPEHTDSDERREGH